MRLFVLLSFMIYLVVFVVCQQVIGMCHAVRNVQRQEYPLFLIYVAVAQILILLGMFTMLNSRLDNLLPVRISGFAVVVIGLSLSMWSQHVLGRHWVGGIGLHDKHKLVTTGPYRYVRHPLYTGLLVSAVGLCLVTLNVFYGLGCLVFAGAYTLRSAFEDALLRKRFGEQYVQYAAKTGAIIPRLGGG